MWVEPETLGVFGLQRLSIKRWQLSKTECLGMQRDQPLRRAAS
jgi:hypothetical protein